MVLLQAADLGVLTNLAPVAKSQLERAGFKVEMQTMDWQSLVNRLTTKKGPPSEGGWNAFATSWVQTRHPRSADDAVSHRDLREGARRLALRRRHGKAARPLRARREPDQKRNRRGGAGLQYQDRHPHSAGRMVQRRAVRSNVEMLDPAAAGHGVLGHRKEVSLSPFALDGYEREVNAVG